MLIPKYWAQYKQRFDALATADRSSKQATIKRYGWSDISQAEALAHAKERVNEAHQRWLDGEDIVRRERREEYNESNGIPIREQIISEQIFSENGLTKAGVESHASDTQLVVTRNSYGAQIANVNNIAIIDADNDQLLHYRYPERYNYHGFMSTLLADEKTSGAKMKVWLFIFFFILIASIISWLGASWLWLLMVMIGVTAYLWQQASKREKARMQKYTEDSESLSSFITDLIQQRVASHPTESFRLYKTPAGFRIIATHDTISPSDALVADWFEYFHADANYVRLCQAQQCFRARLTAKPWRMAEGEDDKLAKDIPAKKFWFDAESTDADSSIEQRQNELKARKQWIVDYDKYAKNYRACRYIESFIGKESTHQLEHKDIQAFIEWHDRVCNVGKEELPLG
ncbi:hypothetical protein [Psychrobacter sp. AOP7-B1-24]|uniref:hypothetical protein n=1 Tax=Psychrobacter sp. AOP7-B1-24 TaxID=3457645 RepID=UPI00402B5969